MTTKKITRSKLILAAGAIAAVALIAARSKPSLASAGEYEHGGAPQFSLHDFKGSYGMLETGKADGLDFIEVAVIHADGAGNARIEAVETIGGQVANKDALTCTYTVRANGLGEIFCRVDESGEEADGDFVLVDGGREAKIITKPNVHGWTTAIARRQ